MEERQRRARASASTIDASLPNELISYAEADTGIVNVIGRGFWTEEMVDRHFVELHRLSVVARKHLRVVRVLVDLRCAAVQSPTVATAIKNETRRVWTQQDRIAVVLRSPLGRLQIDRVVDNRNHASFIAIEDARTWLGLILP